MAKKLTSKKPIEPSERTEIYCIAKELGINLPNHISTREAASMIIGAIREQESRKEIKNLEEIARNGNIPLKVDEVKIDGEVITKANSYDPTGRKYGGNLERQRNDLICYINGELQEREEDRLSKEKLDRK